MFRNIALLLLSGFFALSLTACEQDDGPVEEAAEAVESAGDAVEDAVD